MDSNELFEKSLEYVPGGVHSPVRSFKGLPRTPVFFERAQGPYIYDTEQKDYIDFCMSFGPLILGHKDPVVEKALVHALSKGWSYGACEPYSLLLSEFLVNNISHIEQVRFVNSGTEAVMTALRLARGITGKNKILKFNGCYHGHVDSMLIKAGSGLAGEAESSSLGVSQAVANETLIAELNDREQVEKIFEDHKDQIAAIIVEPLPANNGLLIQDQAYLEFLREISKNNNTLLIFDEVISGFRFGLEGISGETQITPDIVTYGKVIGGGLPVGAIAGSKKVMEALAPIGGVYQAGTLSANPLAMVAGLATLKQMTSEKYNELESHSISIVAELNKWLLEFNNGQFSANKFHRKGSLFWCVKGELPKKACDIPETLMQDFNPMYMELLNRGIYLAPNAYEVGFVSLAHGSCIDELKDRLWN